jgi:uncharacterized protein YciW
LPAAKLRGLAQILEEGGPELQAEFMAELRETHLGKAGAQRRARVGLKAARSVAMKKLQAAYEAELAKREQ